MISDGQWHTLDALVESCGGTHASIYARLRDLRKKKFGEHKISSRRKGSKWKGVWQYRLGSDTRDL